jgi:hypothetical protein
MREAYEAPTIDVAGTQRQLGDLEQSTADQFQTIRTLAGSADASFTFGPRASRPVSGAEGDRYFATDRNWLYFYTGIGWAFIAGLVFGTNATRAAITPDATDNGAAFYTTDTNKLWRVSSGVWVDGFVSIDCTTSFEVNGTKVIGARGAAVADVASPDATDLATAITLVNEIKAQVNTAFARLRSTTGHGLWI